MCDTMAAGGTAAATGSTIFAKNSDRARNEAQFLELLPARGYGAGKVVRTTCVAMQPGYRAAWLRFNRLFRLVALAAE